MAANQVWTGLVQARDEAGGIELVWTRLVMSAEETSSARLAECADKAGASMDR